MKKVVILTESELVNLIENVINESDEKKYFIVARPDHLRGKGMFIYTGDDGYSMVPTSLEYKRRMFDDMSSPPKSYDTRKEAEKDLKTIRRMTKNRPEIRWEITSL